jgi:hypothetical protein
MCKTRNLTHRFSQNRAALPWCSSDMIVLSDVDNMRAVELDQRKDCLAKGEKKTCGTEKRGKDEKGRKWNHMGSMFVLPAIRFRPNKTIENNDNLKQNTNRKMHQSH